MWIPIVVALLIWSSWPWISNPILFIILGGLAGYLWLRRQEKLLSDSELSRKESEMEDEGL